MGRFTGVYGRETGVRWSNWQVSEEFSLLTRRIRARTPRGRNQRHRRRDQRIKFGIGPRPRRPPHSPAPAALRSLLRIDPARGRTRRQEMGRRLTPGGQARLHGGDEEEAGACQKEGGRRGTVGIERSSERERAKAAAPPPGREGP
ncbi:hypothetical protein B0H17DRAFT_1142114 [Mycena rosella]|uniref:Uncharacterized protein n=1 Tax=Mycena rosella TaxID=1033263 RepID=A0AAD7G9S1_MYCRO|nr:hypothetical protein B0H17DRAFT_1142114 [Mycena rosella]